LPKALRLVDITDVKKPQHLPLYRWLRKISIPLIAAGGIATGRGMLAAMVLGADAVQVGSRFIATPEASSHQAFKDMILKLEDGDTHLTLKELAPVRLIKNKFYNDLMALMLKAQPQTI
jgi:enoyl-[acyl-carrier protein] reductase II